MVIPESARSLAPVRVLFIAGTGRSGSTLLASVLGQAPGVFNAGEVRYIWQRGMAENRLCGCGRHFGECPVWTRVVESAQLPPASDMAHVQADLTRVRHLVGLGSPGGASAGAYRDALARLYRSIAEVAGARLVVDSSKLPSYGRILASTPGIELYVVHLVRDPRAAARSWSSVKAQPDRGTAGTMERISPLKSAVLWDLWNWRAAGLGGRRAAGYLRLRYEDFVAQPRLGAELILRMAGMESAELPFSDEHTVELKPNHTVAGNPDRLKSGRSVISFEAGTRTPLRRRDELIVTALTLPTLGRFGYRLASNGYVKHDRVGIQHLPAPLRTLRRLQRHWRWGREEGFGRLVEEDQLDPRARLAGHLRRQDWRRHHPVQAGDTTPVFLVGLQRSGTNMVARALEANPEFEVRNENDRDTFDRFELRALPVVRDVVIRCRQRYLVLKPLIDSHRVDELLGSLGTPVAPRALWTYRSVDGRVRSSVSKFGDHNVQVLRAIASGHAAGVWQGRRLSPDAKTLVASLDLDAISLESASAVIWYVRNSLFFDLGLDAREDCLLVSYDQLVESPEAGLRRISGFLGSEFQPDMAAGIGRRGGSAPARLDLDPRVRSCCDELEARFEKALLPAVTV